MTLKGPDKHKMHWVKKELKKIDFSPVQSDYSTFCLFEEAVNTYCYSIV